MDKDDIRGIIQNVKSGAGEGLKKAGDVAKKAASGVNDGLDNAKESLKKVAYAKDALHEIQTGIKELEEENKVRTHEDVYNETCHIVDLLKSLQKKIRKDPENCEGEIDLVEAECREQLKELLGREVAGEELQKVQVLSKRYEDAVMICLKVKEELLVAKQKKRQWYIIRNDSAEELDKATPVIEAAGSLEIKCAHVISGTGDVSAVGAYCNVEELHELMKVLEMPLQCAGTPNSAEIKLFERNIISK